MKYFKNSLFQRLTCLLVSNQLLRATFFTNNCVFVQMNIYKQVLFKGVFLNTLSNYLIIKFMEYHIKNLPDVQFLMVQHPERLIHLTCSPFFGWNMKRIRPGAIVQWM